MIADAATDGKLTVEKVVFESWMRIRFCVASKEDWVIEIMHKL